MKDFDYWKKKFDKQELLEFSTDKEGLLWLKLKSISKKEPMEKFLQFADIELSSQKVSQRWRELYDRMSDDIDSSISVLDSYAREETSAFLSGLNIEALSDELYKVRTFKWGGDQSNSLDRYLVTHYVKKVDSYSRLQSKAQEIGDVSYGYVVSSWYNHWTSILIESVFKGHPNVVSTVAQVKGVDFYVNDVPFDLKVTSLPKGFVNEQMERRGICKNELCFLKSKAKKLGITFDKKSPDDEIKYAILCKLKDLKTSESIDALNEYSRIRSEILDHATEHPAELAKWLYENQGEMRFGAENRIFLILVNNEKWEDSWKLKRNVSLLKLTITNYLDEFVKKDLSAMRLDFVYKSRDYTTYADVLFVIKD